jgi:hypothetical protein
MTTAPLGNCAGLSFPRKTDSVTGCTGFHTALNPR